MKHSSLGVMVEAISRVSHYVATCGIEECVLEDLELNPVEFFACVMYSSNYRAWLRILHSDTVWS
jgi:hypothetical protein